MSIKGTIKDCIAKIHQSYPELNRSEVARLSEYFDQLKVKYAGDIGALREATKEAVNDFEIMKKLDASMEAHKTLRTALNLKHVTQDNFHNNLIEGARSLVVGTSRNVENMNMNASSISDGIYGDYTGALNKAVHPILHYFKEEWFNDSVIIEAFDRPMKGTNTSLPPQVSDFVDFIGHLNRKMVNRLQDAGATIRYHEGFVFGQTHNKDLIQVNTLEWVNDIVEGGLLDIDKSFGKNISTDAQVRTALFKWADELADLGLASPNIMGGRRQLIFKDGESFVSYNKKWGHGDLLQGINRSIRNMANKTALTEIFGDGGIKAVNEFKDKINDLFPRLRNDPSWVDFDRSVMVFSGTGNQGDHILFDAVQTSKQVANLILLGKAAEPALLDIPMQAAALRNMTGESFFTTMPKAVGSFLKGFKYLSKEQRLELQSALNTIIDDPVREMLEVTGSYKVNTLSKMNNINAYINLVKPITMMSRGSGVEQSAIEFRSMIRAPKLNEKNIQFIKSMGFSDLDIANLKTISDSNPKEFLTSAVVENFGGELKVTGVKSLVRSSAYKNQLQSKLSAMYNTMLMRVSPRINNKTNSNMMAGRWLPRSKWTRAFYEYFNQYKLTLLNVQDTLATYMRQSDPSGRLMSWNSGKNLAATTLTLTAWHLMVTEMSDQLEGVAEAPEKWEDPSFLADKIKQAMIKSGALGFVAESGMQEIFGRGGGGGGRSLAPVGGVAQRFTNLLDKHIATRFQDAEGVEDYRARIRLMRKKEQVKEVETIFKDVKKFIPFVGNNILINAILNRTILEASNRTHGGR